MARKSKLSDFLDKYWPWIAAGGVGIGAGLLAKRILNNGTLFIIPIENHGYDQTINNPNLPYLNRLAQQYAVCTSYQQRWHPSLPNYLVMTSGQTWGISDDSYHLVRSNGLDLFAQMTSSGVPWRAYAESMGRPCRTTDTELYASRHNPAVYFDSVVNGGNCQQQVVDLSQLPSDLASNAVRYAFITPNLQNDWHDGSAGQLDAWLSQWVPMIMQSPGYQRGGCIVIVADEDDSGSGRIPCVVISDRLVQAPFADSTQYDHRSLCAMAQDFLGIGRLPATQGVNSLASMLR